LRARREERETQGKTSILETGQARQFKYMRDWLYSKRPSKKVDSKCNPTRKAEHKRGN